MNLVSVAILWLLTVADSAARYGRAGLEVSEMLSRRTNSRPSFSNPGPPGEKWPNDGPMSVPNPVAPIGRLNDLSNLADIQTLPHRADTAERMLA
jgi:hypothetical protein